MDDYVDDYDGVKRAERYVPVKWISKVCPNKSPEKRKAVSLKEISDQLKETVSIRQACQTIPKKIARFIEEKLKERTAK